VPNVKGLLDLSSGFNFFLFTLKVIAAPHQERDRLFFFEMIWSRDFGPAFLFFSSHVALVPLLEIIFSERVFSVDVPPNLHPGFLSFAFVTSSDLAELDFFPAEELFSLPQTASPSGRRFSNINALLSGVSWLLPFPLPFLPSLNWVVKIFLRQRVFFTHYGSLPPVFSS